MIRAKLFIRICIINSISFKLNSFGSFSLRQPIQTLQMKAPQPESQNQELQQLLVNLIQKKQPPNLAQAMNYKQKKSVKHHAKFSPFNLKQSCHQFGPGVNLYFSLLKYLTFLFIILFLNATPSLISNLKGNGLDIYHDNAVSHIKIDIMKTSLANIPIASFTPTQNADSAKSLDQIHSHSILYRRIVILNDIWLTFILVCFFIFWEIKSKEIINQDTKNVDLPSYRTLVMANIFSEFYHSEHTLNEMMASPDEKTTERKLNQLHRVQDLSIEQRWQFKIKNHFEKFCKVDSVTIMYDYGDTLQQLIDFNQTVKEYSQICDESNNEKKVFLYELLKVKFQLIKNDYLSKTKSNMKKFDVPFLPKQAFVTFHTKQDRNRVRNLYKYRVSQDQLKFSLHDQNFTEIQNKKLIPRVKKCRIEPVSITWQNFHRKKRDESKATLVIGTILCIVLCLALVAILLLSMKMAGLIDKTWHIDAGESKSSIMETVIEHPTYQQAAHASNVKTLYNFCSSLELSYSKFHLDYYNLCEQYFTNFTEQWLTMLILSGLILTINLILNYITYALVDYRRHRTTTEKNRFLIVNIFLVYLVNMVLIILLIRADFDQNSDTSTSLVQLIKFIFPQFETHRKIQTYSQFNRKWYIHIGNQLVFNYVVSLIACPWLYVVLYWLFQKAKLVIVKFKAFSKHQAQLNQILLSEQFDFQTLYAMILVSFYFCLMFGTGMPVFYLLGALSFLSLYMSSQFIFYHFCAVPQPFDHSINTFISKILLFGLGMHQIVAIFFLQVKDIFPQKEATESSKDRSANYTLKKLQEEWVFIMMLVLVIIFYMTKKQIASLIKKKCAMKDAAKQLNEQQIMKEIDINAQDLRENSIFGEDEIKNSQVEESLQPKAGSNNILKDFRSEFLQKYYYRMQDNKAYSNIYYTLTVFHKIVYNQEFRVPSNQKIQIEGQNVLSEQKK